jgi:hypothetical protein
MATMVAALMLTGVAWAESVNIGMGTMDRAEFDQLKQMVNGHYHAATASVSTPVVDESRVAEFNVREVEAIRHAMHARPAEHNMIASASTGMVDIGTGTMSTSEFCNLNNLVASNQITPTGGFSYLCP